MTSLLDAWRAVDPDARLVSGSDDLLTRPIRGVAHTRATAPHLPPLSPGQLLVADADIVPAGGLDALLEAAGEPGTHLGGLWIVGLPKNLDRAGAAIPILAGTGTVGSRAAAAAAYMEGEPAVLDAIAADIRLAAAEAALADPSPSAPAGVVAARLRRGVAVAVDGALASLTPRPAGRALATRFAATHARLLANRTGSRPASRTRDGLWVLSRSATAGATAWLFDDLPFARVDERALDVLAVTLRALLRRPVSGASSRAARPPRLPPSTGDALRDTLLAVARANGRVAPAARSLGVHRNTVLYRLRRASAELGIDPRRPEDALRLLQEARRD